MIRIDLKKRLEQGTERLRKEFNSKPVTENQYLESYWSHVSKDIDPYSIKYNKVTINFNGCLADVFGQIKGALGEKADLSKFIKKIAGHLNYGSLDGLEKKLMIAGPSEIKELVEEGIELSRVSILALKKIFRYENSTYQRRVKKYFGMLDWHVCIYCGRNNIPQFEVEETNNGKAITKLKRAYQLDHFYDKATYPYLALSFYNLVPCCSFCNSKALKGNHSIGEISPWSDDYKFNDEVKFKVSDLGLLDQKGRPLQEPRIFLGYDRRGDYADQIEVLRLENVYQEHSQQAAKLRAKIKAYPDIEIERMAKLSGKSFEELKRRIFEPLYHEDTSDIVPLSKLSHDIHEQLGIEPKPGDSIRL